MISHICIFEDSFFSQLLPLVYFRPTYNLRCGIFSLKEKIMHAFPRSAVTLHTRSYLADYMRLRSPGVPVNELKGDSCLFLNGRVIIDESIVKKISSPGYENTAFVQGETVVAANISGEKLRPLKDRLPEVFSLSDFSHVKHVPIETILIRYPWDLIHHNGDQIRSDFSFVRKRTRGKSGRPSKNGGVYLVNAKEIIVGAGSVLQPGVVIDAQHGPVYIGKNVTVMPFSMIVGPAYIGDGSVVKTGAKIYQNTSIGPVCKVGGEIEESIIHSYSNKQHDGFLGHSYLGAWVNCGAGTVTSDLKNNYSTVKVHINDERIDSGMQFVGVTIGDHSKTAINSTFNTGTVVGVSSNIFGTGFPPKYVPSFSWGAAGETFTTYNSAKAIEVARKVMSRRNITLSTFEEHLFRKIFELTSGERRKRGMPL